MSKKAKIFVDFDSTIVNTIEAITLLYNEDFKYYKKYKYVHWTDINTWTFKECSCAKPKYINQYFNQQRFFDIVQFMDNAKEVLKKLKDKYEIIVVSCGSHPNLTAKKKWINENMPYAKFEGINLHKYKNKNHIDMAGSVFIDDNAGMLDTNALYKVCFGDIYPWNYGWNGVRCYNWTEIENYIKDIGY